MSVVMSCHDFRVRKALQIIDREPSQTVPKLAMQLRISKSRFSHLFKAQTGMSFKSYVFKRRLEQAGVLLLNSRMEIKEIAYCLGYHHGPSFARAFKAQFGSTPNRYRQAKVASL
jgi:AraC-like DNA-binding protein